MSTKVPTHEMYRTLMLEIKIRLTRTDAVLQSKEPVTGLTSLDAEFCFLQVRKIVELITFSAALRDEERYKRLRELQKKENPRDHGDHAKDWEAAKILKRLREITPHFLPIPIKKISSNAPGSFHIDRTSTPVTHGRLIEIYVQCGSYLHARNPLGKDFLKLVNLERSKYEAATSEALKCIKFIKSLIWYHAAIGLEWSDELDPRELANAQRAWLVNFGQEDGEAIEMILAEAK